MAKSLNEVFEPDRNHQPAQLPDNSVTMKDVAKGTLEAALGYREGLGQAWDAVASRVPPEVKAMARQGVDEIGHFLKAFPENYQASELGTVFTPTPMEIQAQKEPDRQQSQERNQERDRGGRER